jgi:predicted PurR-regulated permease PerM
MTQLPHPIAQSRWPTNRVILGTLTVAGIGLAFFLVFQLRVVVFLSAVAVVLGTAIRPAVNRLQERGVLRPVGIFTVYVILGLSVFGFMVMVVPLVVDQGTEMLRNVPEYYENLRAAMLESRSRILTNLALQLPPDLALLPDPEPTAEETLTQMSQTYALAGLILRSFLGTIAVLLVGFYWALEGDQTVRSVLRFLPAQRRAEVRDFLVAAEHKLGGFVRGQVILSVTVGSAALIAYSLIGLPFAFVLAVIAGIFEMIPFFGPALGAIPALLVSVTFDPSTTVWVLIATGVIQLAENAWLVPRIMNHSMGVNPVVTLLSLVTFTSVLGFAGAILALPLAALIQLALDRLTASIDRSGTDPAGLPPAERAEMDSIARELELILVDMRTQTAPETALATALETTRE